MLIFLTLVFVLRLTAFPEREGEAVFSVEVIEIAFEQEEDW